MMKHVFAYLIILILASCRTVSKEPDIVVARQIDTLRIATHTQDSIYIHDSTVIYTKQDTVYTDRWHTAFRYINSHDTIYQHKVDSIPKPYPVEVLKAYTPWYAKTLAWVGGIVIIAFFIVVLIKVRKFIS